MQGLRTQRRGRPDGASFRNSATAAPPSGRAANRVWVACIGEVLQMQQIEVLCSRRCRETHSYRAQHHLHAVTCSLRLELPVARLAATKRDVHNPSWRQDVDPACCRKKVSQQRAVHLDALAPEMRMVKYDVVVGRPIPRCSRQALQRQVARVDAVRDHAACCCYALNK